MLIDWIEKVLIAIVLLTVCAAFVYLITHMIRIIPQQHVAVVERFGRYNRLLKPGFHFIIPFADKIRKLQDLRIQQAEVPSQMVITKDNVQIKIDTVFFYNVEDAMTATYSIHNFVHAIQSITAANIRQVVGKMELDETLSGRERISQDLRNSLDEATEKWGVRIERVEVIDIHPPLEIHHAMEKQMKAEREKRANILQAEGERQAAILRAEGEKQAKILQAEGQKEANIRIAEGHQLSQELDAKGNAAAIRIVAQAEKDKIELIAEAEKRKIATIAEGEKIRIDRIQSAGMDSQFLSYKSLEALGEIAKGHATTVFVPTEAVQVLSALGSFSKLNNTLKKHDQESLDSSQ